MKLSALAFANLVVASVLLVTPLLVGLTASAPYDPWYDLDENGKIDIFDVVRIAGTYGTTGDSGKNVTVTNWPLERALFPENLVLRGAYFYAGGSGYRRDLIDESTYHPPSTWPSVLAEAETITGTLDATYQLFYNETFTHQKIPLEPYLISGNPTVTVTMNLSTDIGSQFQLDCLAHLGRVSPDGNWIGIAFLSNTSMGFSGQFTLPETFTWTMSPPPNPPLMMNVDPGWRLAIRLEIYGRRFLGSDTNFSLDILCRRNADDFVVDIPIVHNP